MSDFLESDFQDFLKSSGIFRLKCSFHILRAQFMETDYRKEIFLKLSKAETKEEIERDKIKAQNDIIHFDPINCDVRFQCSGKC